MLYTISPALGLKKMLCKQNHLKKMVFVAIDYFNLNTPASLVIAGSKFSSALLARDASSYAARIGFFNCSEYSGSL